MTQKKYTFRNLARIVIETKTPLAVGSGEGNILTDQAVARDVNGLPYIPGTAIAGIIRSALQIKKYDKSVFGFIEAPKKRPKENINEGSQIIFSSAHIVNKENEVMDGMFSDVFEDEYLRHFKELPVRQHVCIDVKGTAKDKGKFDEEVVYKGARFCFEIELLSRTANNENFQQVLHELSKDTIRIGRGTRKGFGEIAIVACKQTELNLANPAELDLYLNKTSSLNDDFWKSDSGWDGQGIPAFTGTTTGHGNDGWTSYELKLKPDDFFLFGSGFSDEEVDMTPVSESYIDWTNEKPEIKTDTILIPGSSVKGALSHRTAFHYNKIKKYFVGNQNAKSDVENIAVQTLFGYTNEKDMARGNVLISDVIREKNSEQPKILNHVSIDRFTGGAIEGALFSEKVIYGNGKEYILSFKVKNEALTDNDIQQAFENALYDITAGLLPLGGGTNRGHGCFTGKIIKNGEEIKRYE